MITQQFNRRLRMGFAFAAFACLLCGPLKADLASATFTSTQLTATTFQYDITLDNIGTTNIGTFWFAWVPGADFMPTPPSNIVSPTNWTDNVTHGGGADGYAIQWLASVPLGPGDSLSGFMFDSATTPAEMAGLAAGFAGTPPVTTSFIYQGGPFSDPGFQFVVQQVTATPEPSGKVMVMLGVLMLFGLRSWRNATGRTSNLLTRS